MSLVSSIMSLSMSQLGVAPIRGQFGQGLDFSTDTLMLGLRFVVFGVGAWYFRHAVQRLPEQIDSLLFPSAYITGPAVQWVASYIARNPEAQVKLWDRQIHAEDENSKGPAKRDYYEQYYGDGSSVAATTAGSWVREGVLAGISPLESREIAIHFQGKKIWLMKSKECNGREEMCNSWRFRTWFWNRSLVDDFLSAAHKLHHEKTVVDLHVYTDDLTRQGSSSIWTGPTNRPVRKWDSVILPRESKEDIAKDVVAFLSDSEREWYASKGIPHRRGYLLHGPPGCGKTAFVTALASKLRLDLYCVTPGSKGMCNEKLEALFRACPKRSILLIEDIDCILSTERRESEPELVVVNKKSGASVRRTGPSDSTVTLSGMLNAIDGITSQESSVLFASTNHPGNLDEALMRPGRFDVHVRFTYAKHAEAAAIFKHFYAIKSTSTADLDDGSKEEDGLGHKLDMAAAVFADSVIQPDVNVSIAAIQGYLLLHKRDPELALEKVGEWISQLREQQITGNLVRR